MSTAHTDTIAAGLWKPRSLDALHYGSQCVEKNLLSCLPSENSKAFIITGASLAKTPLVAQLEKLLGSKHHAGTFSNIKQHAPVAQLDEATGKVAQDPNIDTLISLGGGSPIDSAKAISARQHDKTGKYLYHITIPTTLSAAECTQLAGYTKEDGTKTGVADPKIAVSAIFYDPAFAAHTPLKLWLATGLRAMDHAVESIYHPAASEVPCKAIALQAIQWLFEYLPKAKESHPHNEDVTTRLFLAAYASLGFIGLNISGGLGLSHSLGYALGSPYGIPHGETSCLTLGHVVKLKARMSDKDAASCARILPFVGGATSTGDNVKDADQVGDAILGLVERLNLKTTLTEKGVGKDQMDIIVQRATGGKADEKTAGAVKTLVEKLY